MVSWPFSSGGQKYFRVSPVARSTKARTVARGWSAIWAFTFVVTAANGTLDTVAVTNNLRDQLANFDDFFRPMRNYFYWEPHCFDIPICAALRSVFDSLDGINQLSDQFQTITSASGLTAWMPSATALFTSATRSAGGRVEQRGH